MARIRTLKPEILEDENTAGLSDRAWRLFTSMILLADDYGNLRADTRWLAGQVFWAHDVRDVTEWVDELADHGLLKVFAVRGQRYAAVTNWDKHQKIDKPGKPRVPSIEEAEQVESTTCGESSIKIQKVSRESRKKSEKLATDLSTTTTTLGPRPPTDEERGFLAVFDHYRSYHPRAHPKPNSKSKEWRNIRDRFAEGRTAADICAAIDGYHLDPFHLGQNDRNKAFLGLELITRLDSNILKGIEWSQNPPSPALTRKGQEIAKAMQSDIHMFDDIQPGRLLDEARRRAAISEAPRQDVRALPGGFDE